MELEQESMTITVNDDNLHVRAIDVNGCETVKYISYETFVKCVHDSTDNGIEVRTGILPRGIVHYSHLSKAQEEIDVYVLALDCDREDITYHETTFENFPIPRFLVRFELSEGKVRSVGIGIIPMKGAIREDTPMFYYPFSNIYYSTNFKLCTGSNSLPIVKNLASLPNLARYILRLPNNDDFYNYNRNKLGIGQGELMDLLQDKDQAYYYEHILIPMPNKTVQNFFKLE